MADAIILKDVWGKVVAILNGEARYSDQRQA